MLVDGYSALAKEAQAQVFGVGHSVRSWSNVGVLVGAIALLGAVIHFFVGPIERAPTLEQIVALKAASVRDAARSVLSGQAAPSPQDHGSDRFGPDRIVNAATGGLGGIAIVLGAIGFARREDRYSCAAAAALGCGAIAFHFVVIAVGALIFLAVLGTVLTGLGPG